MILFVTSDCLSNCRSKADENCKLMPASMKSSCQKRPVNAGSRSLTMEMGMPWSLVILSKKTHVMVVVEYGCPSGRKWADLDNLSTIIRMTERPLTLGRFSMKSILMSA
jgi:hypothetical protein